MRNIHIELFSPEQKVGGSNPLGRTTFIFIDLQEVSPEPHFQHRGSTDTCDHPTLRSGRLNTAALRSFPRNPVHAIGSSGILIVAEKFRRRLRHAGSDRLVSQNASALRRGGPQCVRATLTDAAPATAAPI
jgi:hypothetical protein